MEPATASGTPAEAAGVAGDPRPQGEVGPSPRFSLPDGPVDAAARLDYLLG
jgi:hypothetical protein